MGTAEQLITAKGEPLAALGPEASVLDAARLMNDRHIGSVVVVDAGRLAGIFTERDVMRRVVAEQRDPATTRLADVMTTPVACAAPHTRLNEMRQVMRDKRIRHIPVTEGNTVIGMVSIGDLNKAAFDGQVETIRYLEQYMSVA